MSTLTLTIPAPCAWISSNDRLHHRVKAPLVASWRKAAKEAAEAHPGWVPFEGPVQIFAYVHKTRGGRWDAGNLYDTAKPIVDGLVDAGVIPDDSNEYVTGPDMRAGAKSDTAHVVVTVEAIR